MVIDSDISANPLLSAHVAFEAQVDFPGVVVGGFFAEAQFQEGAAAFGGGCADRVEVTIYDACRAVSISAKFIGEGCAGVEAPVVLHLVIVATADAEEFAGDRVEADFGDGAVLVIQPAGMVQIELGVNIPGICIAGLNDLAYTQMEAVVGRGVIQAQCFVFILDASRMEACFAVDRIFAFVTEEEACAVVSEVTGGTGDAFADAIGAVVTGTAFIVETVFSVGSIGQIFPCAYTGIHIPGVLGNMASRLGAGLASADAGEDHGAAAFLIIAVVCQGTGNAIGGFYVATGDGLHSSSLRHHVAMSCIGGSAGAFPHICYELLLVSREFRFAFESDRISDGHVDAIVILDIRFVQIVRPIGMDQHHLVRAIGGGDTLHAVCIEGKFGGIDGFAGEIHF